MTYADASAFITVVAIAFFMMSGTEKAGEPEWPVDEMTDGHACLIAALLAVTASLYFSEYRIGASMAAAFVLLVELVLLSIGGMVETTEGRSPHQ